MITHFSLGDPFNNIGTECYNKSFKSAVLRPAGSNTALDVDPTWAGRVRR